MFLLETALAGQVLCKDGPFRMFHFSTVCVAYFVNDQTRTALDMFEDGICTNMIYCILYSRSTKPIRLIHVGIIFTL